MDARLFMSISEKDQKEAKRIAEATARRVENKDLKFLDIVQSLREYLTDDDITIRSKAIGYLSAVLSELDLKIFSRQQVPIIVQFLCDRLEDENGLGESCSGLLALSRMPHFGNDEAILVMTALMKLDLPKHPPTTRFEVLKSIDALMFRHRKALKDMGEKFVIGLAELVGGEKDPRNLMIVFSVVKVVLVEFDIVRHSELLFDVVYCYFPISFTPPPDDSYHITAQDLKTRLRECLASTHYFAKPLFPLLIEKLDSTSPSVKLDVLQTMATCARSYGQQTISSHCTQLWDAVKYEIFNSSGQDETAREALSVLISISATLSTGLKTPPVLTAPFGRFLKAIFQECMKLLQQPQHKQAKPAGKVLASIGSASSVSLAFIIQSSIPAILLLYADMDSILKRRALLEILNEYFDSALVIYGDWMDSHPYLSTENLLSEFSDKLFEVYSQALMGSHRDEVSYRLTAMRGLGKLCRIKQLFDDSEIGIVIKYLGEIALDPYENSDMHEEAMESLRGLSTFRSGLILSITFPALMAQLPDSDKEKTQYNRILETLAKLSFDRSIFDVLLTRLLNKLSVVLSTGSGPEYVKAILSTILYVLEKKQDMNHENLKAYYTRLIPPLLTKITSSIIDQRSSESLHVLANNEILEITGRLISSIMRGIGEELQEQIIRAHFDLFVRNNESSLINESPGKIAQNFRPLDERTDERQSESVCILTSVLAAASRNIPFPTEDILEFVILNIKLAEHPVSPTHRLALLRIVGIVINKWMKGPDVDKLQNMFESLLVSIVTGPPSIISNERIRILFWISKALILRSDKFGMEKLETLVEFLGVEKFGSMASRGFPVLFGDDEFLNQKNHAIVRLLAKQRAFSICVPKIVGGFTDAPTGLKKNYLIALSHILKNTPSSIIITEIPAILPLLLQSMELPDCDVKSATIETIQVTMKESSEALKEHASTVITRLLSASSSAKPADKTSFYNPPRIRTAALKCLGSFPGALRTELLLPYKRQVMKNLLPVLDDPKRTVRKEGVDCRAKWFAMDEPEN